MLKIVLRYRNSVHDCSVQASKIPNQELVILTGDDAMLAREDGIGDADQICDSAANRGFLLFQRNNRLCEWSGMNYELGGQRGRHLQECTSNDLAQLTVRLHL